MRRREFVDDRIRQRINNLNNDQLPKIKPIKGDYSLNIGPYSYDENSPLQNLRKNKKLKINNQIYDENNNDQYKTYQDFKKSLKNTHNTTKQSVALLSNYLSQNDNFNHLNIDENEDLFDLAPGNKGFFSSKENNINYKNEKYPSVNPWKGLAHELTHAYSYNYPNEHGGSHFSVLFRKGLSDKEKPKQLYYENAQDSIDKTGGFKRVYKFDNLVGNGEAINPWIEDEFIAHAIQNLDDKMLKPKFENVKDTLYKGFNTVSKNFREIIPNEAQQHYKSLYEDLDNRLNFLKPDLENKNVNVINAIQPQMQQLERQRPKSLPPLQSFQGTSKNPIPQRYEEEKRNMKKGGRIKGLTSIINKPSSLSCLIKHYRNGGSVDAVGGVIEENGPYDGNPNPMVYNPNLKGQDLHADLNQSGSFIQNQIDNYGYDYKDKKPVFRIASYQGLGHELEKTKENVSELKDIINPESKLPPEKKAEIAKKYLPLQASQERYDFLNEHRLRQLETDLAQREREFGDYAQDREDNYVPRDLYNREIEDRRIERANLRGQLGLGEQEDLNNIGNFIRQGNEASANAVRMEYQGWVPRNEHAASQALAEQHQRNLIAEQQRAAGLQNQIAPLNASVNSLRANEQRLQNDNASLRRDFDALALAETRLKQQLAAIPAHRYPEARNYTNQQYQQLQQELGDYKKFKSANNYIFDLPDYMQKYPEYDREYWQIKPRFEQLNSILSQGTDMVKYPNWNDMSIEAVRLKDLMRFSKQNPANAFRNFPEFKY